MNTEMMNEVKKWSVVPPTILYLIDKKDWPKGEWKKEPDVIEWEDVNTNLNCIIYRSGVDEDDKRSGALMGYVQIPEGYEKLAKNYREDLAVHGGVSYIGSLRGYNGKWMGFDTHHTGDLLPLGKNDKYASEYRNIYYVKNNVVKLAKQLNSLVTLKGKASDQETIDAMKRSLFEDEEPSSAGIGGVALRDYFAGKAIQSLILLKDQKMESVDAMAEEAYHIADALLEMRNK